MSIHTKRDTSAPHHLHLSTRTEPGRAPRRPLLARPARAAIASRTPEPSRFTTAELRALVMETMG